MERFIEWRLSQGEHLEKILGEIKWAILNLTWEPNDPSTHIKNAFLEFCRHQAIR